MLIYIEEVFPQQVKIPSGSESLAIWHLEVDERINSIAPIFVLANGHEGKGIVGYRYDDTVKSVPKHNIGTFDS